VVVTVGEEDGSDVYLNGVVAEHADTVPEMQMGTAAGTAEMARGEDGKSVVFYEDMANFMLQNESEIVKVGKFL